MRKRQLIALVAVCVIAAGIMSTEAQPSGSVQLNFGNPGSVLSPNTMIEAPTMPPPLWVQPTPRPPGPGFVYVDGNWAWNGGAWVWVPGAWVQPPPGPRVRWSPGHWDRRGRRGSRWVGGRWR
jgi:hypothetical protein